MLKGKAGDVSITLYSKAPDHFACTMTLSNFARKEIMTLLYT